MSGLRERQKAERRQAISQAAIELFERQGFQNTTIEQIASQAGVSPPTVFKYFGNKQEIILEILRHADQRAITDTRSLIHTIDDPVDALCHLERLLTGYALEVMHPSLWRELLPLILFGGSNELPAGYRAMNDALRAQISELLRELQRAGKLRPQLDVELAAFLLNDYSHLQLFRLVNQEHPDIDAHSTQVRRITELLFYGMQA
ncbi:MULTISPECIES: TetR/AcrR family transcriptional regulator [Pseudomonas]|uniref:TetR-family transcriptional regulator n=2 Tax=Pseudomonas fluorescens TaxID=294 RepID=C3KCA8_PSEFS|nr:MULTISPECIES: TetR/AcrR family transcriptional regulator [Pseudomonas]MBZ6454334.1 TetR/AcrR family transcriptional regulator [Pseudomonas fluorescens group sp.]KJZ51419.1 TetR family transcriptional regulator [Pseudomonas marginalis]KJZ54763.1 TetR family transcriptional regulator [Pseudomonas marginalis]MBZ6460319.1 TetR/AcrR family transcriptional regulator [Pseudomonas fluorescens group sp.]MBZ6465961.1 TetR/AcrR family transcriptional regulator [Pseudomonas fluorescens group sp.]